MVTIEEGVTGIAAWIPHKVANVWKVSELRKGLISKITSPLIKRLNKLTPTNQDWKVYCRDNNAQCMLRCKSEKQQKEIFSYFEKQSKLLSEKDKHTFTVKKMFNNANKSPYILIQDKFFNPELLFCLLSLPVMGNSNVTPKEENNNNNDTNTKELDESLKRLSM